MVLVFITMAFIVSACFCLLANYICQTQLRGKSITQISGGIVLWILGLGFSFFLPITLLQYLLLSLFILYLGLAKPEKINPMAYILGLSLIPYLIFLPIFYFQVSNRLNLLREKYPLVSLENRLGKPPIPLPPDQLGFALEGNLVDLEKLLESPPYKDDLRGHLLKILHETTVLNFLANEGFGVERYFGFDPITGYDRANEGNGIFPQPGPSFRTANLGLIPGRTLKEPEKGPVGQLHLKSVAGFSFPIGYGYVKDRQHVAGFESHRFHEPVGAFPSFKISHTELVSLLLQDTPMVYQTENLPRMKDISSIPKRPLDPFESGSLEKIKNGQDLIVADVPEGLRMLGSIRNVEQCIKCHGGKRGDLLGAFSYSIKKMDNPPKE